MAVAQRSYVSVAPVTMRLAMAAGLVVVGWSGAARAQVAPAAPEQVAVGDWQLAPVAEIRLRGEYRRDVDQENHALLVERFRLGLAVARGAVEARVVLQDARAVDLGATADPVVGPGRESVTGAYEAWVDAHTESARPSFVRAGRQAITWGEGRLLGAAEWSPTGRSLDAVRGRLVVGDGAFELLAAALMDPATSASVASYGELFGGRAEWAFDPLFAVDAYVLARVAQADPADSLDASVRGETVTGALGLHGDAHGWGWAAEGAYQIGRVEDLAENRAAWAAAAHLGYTFDGVALRPSLRAGAAYASGGGGSRGETYRAFDPLLPDVHVWHGAADLFAWSNEEEANGRATIAPWTDALAAIEYRYARLARPDGAWRTAYLTTIGRAPGNTEASLGHEIDATLRWSPWPPLAVEAGYSIVLLGAGARAVLAANAIGRPQSAGAVSTPPASHFAYAQATLALP
jgi:hypothetical protein